MLKASVSLDLAFKGFGALALTHKDASVEDISLNYMSARDIRKLAASVPANVSMVVLQTCNRVEIYYYADQEGVVDSLKRALARVGKKMDGSKWKILRGRDAVIHLFRVASGLESLSVGENEVLGQVKDSYLSWNRRGRVNQQLATLFEKAIHVGKRVRTETSISKGKTGVYSLAVAYASQMVDLYSSRVAVVGAGDVCSKIVKMLHDLGVNNVTVLNRTVLAGRRLAQKYGYAYAPLDLHSISGYDVVFSAINYPSRENVDGPRIVVDLSVPPVFIGDNVVYLEELREVATKNAESKKEDVHRAEVIIKEEEEALARRLQQLLADRYISRIMGRIDGIRKREVERAVSALKLKGVDPTLASPILEALTRSIINKTFYRVLEDIKILTYQGDMEHVEYLLSLFDGDSTPRNF
ncbi:MAG: glutamyl-tRNA reductase [Thermoprotei archaeon]